MFKYLLQFLLSGSVVVAATIVGDKVGQKWAGLIVAFPTWTILTYIFISLNGKGASSHEYLIAALVFMIPAAIYIGALLAFPKLNLWLGLAIGLAIYAVAALLVNKWLITS